MLANMKIFDCTIREIGYQTGWNFDKQFLQDVYKFAEEKKLDYLDLGFFHNLEADPNKGIFRYCSEKNEEIYKIFSEVKNRVRLSAMLDIQRPLSTINHKNKSIIDNIRLLTRSNETDLDILKKHIEEIQNLGYELCINFTSSGNNSFEQNRTLAQVSKNMGVDTIYFADTESIMTTDYIVNTINICKDVGINVGMHLHDKNGTVEKLANCAILHGCNSIDVTHLGLGGKWRDGNLTVEYLMKKFDIHLGGENTSLRNNIIEQLIKYNEHSTAE